MVDYILLRIMIHLRWSCHWQWIHRDLTIEIWSLIQSISNNTTLQYDTTKKVIRLHLVASFSPHSLGWFRVLKSVSWVIFTTNHIFIFTSNYILFCGYSFCSLCIFVVTICIYLYVVIITGSNIYFLLLFFNVFIFVILLFCFILF